MAAAVTLFCALPVMTSSAADSVYELENGTIYNTGDNETAVVSLAGASGGKAVDLKDSGDSVTISVNVESAGSYRLSLRYNQPYDEGGKYQDLIVNGTNTGQILCGLTQKDSFAEVSSTAYLKAGNNSITIQGSWGWTYLDCLTVTPASSASVGGSLSNPDASPETQSLYSYLCDTYGNHVISGQQESTWMGSEDYEFEIIHNASGKYPALRGLDYMGDDFSGCNRRAKAWYAKGGIVTICWHCGADFSGSHTESMNTSLNWDKALTPGTAEYNALIAGMDKGAAALKELQEAGVPVIWRPFHEFDGKWFWWGKGGAENFKKLWRIMYDRYTKDWGLNNLIWNLGYCGDVNDGWYPGDEYVDIIGADTYVNHTESLVNIYAKTAQVAGKPVCLHENGPIPDPDKMKADGAGWLWFMTWHTSFIDSNEFNTASYLDHVYNSDYLLTLDELPDIYHYQPDKPDTPETPETVRGDVNGDGSFNVSDAVLLQKWLLAVPETHLADWKAGDICEDNKLDVYDLCAMKEMLSSPQHSENITPEEYTEKMQLKLADSTPAAILEQKSGVDYGRLVECTYWSTTRERNTPCNVLLPPGYNENETYPVFYMLHGYYDDQNWMTRPVVGVQTMMGNLVASGEAEKMIIVFPYIYTSKTMPYVTGMDAQNNQNYDNFIYDLQADLMPYIEKNFSVRTGRENTAISGFSMGARESLYIGMKCADKFGYVGAVCAAPGVTELVPENQFTFDPKPQLLMISAAVNDGVVGNNPEYYHNLYSKNGVAHLWNQLPYGGHDASSVTPHLYNFIRCIFQ